MTSRWSDEYLKQYQDYSELCRKYGQSILNIDDFDWEEHWKYIRFGKLWIKEEKNVNTKKTMIPNPETDKFLLQVFRPDDDICMEVFLTEPSIPRSLIPLCDRYKIQIWEIKYSDSYSTGFNYIPYSGKIGFHRE